MVEPLPITRRRFLSSHKSLVTVFWIAAFASLFIWQSRGRGGASLYRVNGSLSSVFWWTATTTKTTSSGAGEFPRLRPVSFNLTDFGAVGDGVTVNTEAFERAVYAISKLSKKGGGQLNVPPGRWLTAPFNLTSFMTLFLAEDAEILAVQDEKLWPLLPPLPSYGYGREHYGPRYGSFIHGQNLKDVVVTGNNGSINGQGVYWWKKYRSKLLNHTRGPLVQIMWSSDVVFANITLRDSPFWTLHPYDCKNVTITNMTILAPVFEAPNTDGIDPDSCEDMLIENSYISVGDDGIAIKSGWDQYGTNYGRPSKNILIRNLIIRSMVSAGISIGSEMSGGVSNITVENILIWSSRRGVRIKTAPGRGGYVRDITFRNVTLDELRVGIVVKTDYNEHPDGGFNPQAFRSACTVRMQGSKEIPVKNVTFRDMSVGITYKKKHIFQCAYVQGRVIGTIFPAPCENLDRYDEQEQLVKQSDSQNATDIDYEI
ncbi:hypothetical protein Bca52824_067465 [Brassica carinata]|uniref:Polygalacturonase n=1 Tax=Brassica carinata TaxID=52824 RepID=A0A8X7UAZ6_BRACI|nr:hypothetical protein Bca52824_067465 [Brassica carinata]